MTRAAGSRASGPDLGPSGRSLNERLRALPSVEELAGRLADVPRATAVRAAREAIGARREEIRAGVALQPDDRREPDGDALAAPALELDRLVAAARERADAASRTSLRPVLNATGVIVHTNLGRAPLAPVALAAAQRVAAGYSNLEYELDSGRRGSRQDHVEAALCELTGAEAAIVVNNCAAATLLAAAALAGGRELMVSRGQLVEIGDSFRVPDVVAQSGARLVEVGTTNRTRRLDYERALCPDTGAILRVHPSNFRTLGFVEDVSIEELCAVGQGAGVAVIDDLGSGALAHGVPELADEPAVRRSVAAGASVACFSGDKLLGGPQAGVMVGRREAIEPCRRHPLARALRIDKLSLAALEATLALYRDPEGALRDVPVLAMLTAPEAELSRRAEAICATVHAGGVEARVVRAASKVGGGALPLLELEGPLCAVDPGALGVDRLTARLRAGDPPVVGRVGDGRLLLDPRTLDDAGAEQAAAAVITALDASNR